MEYPPVVVVEWIDTTNIATWTDLADIADWARDGGYVCRNVGYLIHEDDDCVVLAARIAFEIDDEQVGLYERIPKASSLTAGSSKVKRPCRPRSGAVSSPPWSPAESSSLRDDRDLPVGDDGIGSAA